VAVLSANLPEYVVAFQGIVHAGAVVSTLNPLYKRQELLPAGLLRLRDLHHALPDDAGGLKEHLPSLRHVGP
jgi:acyl-CoA synthetase (AMP-forming)/AMP-acid ligase II